MTYARPHSLSLLSRASLLLGYAAFLAALTVIYMAPALLNGGPFFYFDSAAYIEYVAKAVSRLWPASAGVRPALGTSPVMPASSFGTVQGDGIVYSGRSVYYGVLAYAGWITTIWVPVILQCLTLGWLTAKHTHRLIGQNDRRIAVFIAAVLAFGSSAGAFAGLVMPDIWAGLAVLALALLWSPGARAGRAAQGVILAILSFAALTHTSHLALIAVLLAVGLIARPFLRAPLRPSRAALVIPALAIGAGLAGPMVFTAAVEATFGQPPLSRPFITAHLVDMGPGTAFARDICATPTYALCAYVDRLPTDWIAFLFSHSATEGVFAVADAATQRALAHEQMSFALGTLSSRPLATIGGLAMDGIRQLWVLSVADVPITRQSQTFLTSSFPPDLVARITATRIYNHPGWAIALTHWIEITSLGSLAVIGVWSHLRRGMAPTLYRLEAFVLICTAGVLANALICGILASPYGRFQARIVWLLPMLVLYILFARSSWLQRRTQPLLRPEFEKSIP